MGNSSRAGSLLLLPILRSIDESAKLRLAERVLDPKDPTPYPCVVSVIVTRSRVLNRPKKPFRQGIVAVRSAVARRICCHISGITAPMFGLP